MLVRHVECHCWLAQQCGVKVGQANRGTYQIKQDEPRDHVVRAAGVLPGAQDQHWRFRQCHPTHQGGPARMYEVFEHTADLGLRIRAADLNELFAQAGQALFGVIVSNPQDVRASETVAYEIAGTEPDYLLFDWLNELLYTFESRRLLLAKFDVHVRPSGLTARAAGEKVDTARHRLEHEVKAITYHGLKLEPDGDGWLAEVILDI